MNRRSLLYGAAAATAGLAGAVVAWRQSSELPISPATSDPDRMGSFWGQSFDTPQGAPLALSSFAGRPLLVNFWATWCPPCVEELPLIDRFYRENQAKKWQVLGLAVDQPSAVRTWLAQRPLSFPVAMAGFGGTELSKTLGNLSGALPFTVVFGPTGSVLHRKSGKVTEEDLSQWARLV